MHAFLITGGDSKLRLNKVKKIIKAKTAITFDSSQAPLDLNITQENPITIKHIRTLKTWATQTPVKAKIKAAVIFDAQNASLPAQQATLKLIEEPPARTIIILTASNKSLLLPTIISRCHLINLRHSASPDSGKNQTLLTNIKQMKPGQKIAAAREYSGSKQVALDFCRLLLESSRFNLRRHPNAHHQTLANITKSITLLNANVNPKLTIENLFINLK